MKMFKANDYVTMVNEKGSIKLAQVIDPRSNISDSMEIKIIDNTDGRFNGSILKWASKSLFRKLPLLSELIALRVGDVIRGIDNYYNITNKKMTEAKIVSFQDATITVKILQHTDPDWVNGEFKFDKDNLRRFVLLKDGDGTPAIHAETPSELELGVTQESPKKETRPDIKTEKKLGLQIITIEGRYTIAIPEHVHVGIAVKHDNDEHISVIGEGVAIHRLLESHHAELEAEKKRQTRKRESLQGVLR